MNTPNISHPALKYLVEYEPHLLLDENGTPDIKKITEGLALELKDRLKGLRVSISDIESLKSRFVLLTGSDDDLLDAVAAYIYCLRSVNGCTSLYYQSFRGKTDDYLIQELTTKNTFKNDTTVRQYEAFSNEEGSGTKVSTTGASTGYPETMDGDLLDHIKQGRSVFLGDLKYPNSLLLEGLGKKIASIKTHWEMYQTDKRGMLIVSTLNENALPVYFAKQFEVIDFNPKQAQASEPITLAAHAGTPAKEPQATLQKQSKFPTPPGTQWNEVKISFIDSENVKLSAKDITAQKHYFDMGFRKGISNKPVASWFVLKGFNQNGYLKYSEIDKAKTEKSIQDLRKRLKAYFGIHGDPITLKDGYRPVFKFCTNESRSRSVKAFSNSEVLNDDDNKDDD